MPLLKLYRLLIKLLENTQDALAGKKNLNDFRSRVQEGKSFRDPAKVFRYSPDVKSYYDYSAASSNVLAKIKEDIGGCFNRFEFKYRYNPYENNMARPIGTKVQIMLMVSRLIARCYWSHQIDQVNLTLIRLR